MKKLFYVFLFCLNAYGANLDSFLNALAKVESSGNPHAVNKKETALGVYQIRPAYFKDSGIKAKHSDVFKPEIAKKVVLAYFKKYEPTALKNLDFETLARCHNGGPSWANRKSKTDDYWKKIQKNLK